MKKLFKWISILFLGLLFLILAIFGVSYYYRSDILAAVNAELKKNINGDFHIGDIDFTLWEDFPAFSITLSDIYLRGSNYDLYRKDFLRADKVLLDVQISSFLQKKIVIRSVKIVRGDVFIFRTKSGYSNLEVFKTNTGDTARSNTPATITFKKVFFDNVNLSYQDSLKQKTFGVHLFSVKTSISQTDSSKQISFTGALKFDDLTLNTEKGSFLKDQDANVNLHVEFASARQVLMVHPSSLKFDKSTLVLSGDFDFKHKTFNLKIQSEDLNYGQGLALLTDHLQLKLKKFMVQKPIELSTIISGYLTPGEPSIDLQFHFNDSQVSAAKVKIEHATVTGSFSNHADSTERNIGANTLLTIRSFSGMIEGLPTKLTATFRDLRDPYIRLQSEISLTLPLLNEKLDPTRMKFLSGDFKSEIRYSGKLSEYLDPDKTKYTGDLLGTVTVKNGAFDYLPRKQHVDHVDAFLRFTKDSVIVKTMTLQLNKNPVSIQGHVLGFVPFFHQPEKKGYVRLAISSSTFDLATLLLKSSHKKLTTSERLEKNKSISETLDKLYSKVEFDLTLNVKKLRYQNFNGSELRGRLLMNNNSLKAVNMKLKLADGDLNFTLGMNDLNKEMKKISVAGVVDRADIREFFYSFNNFNQTAINHRNLEGRVDMNVKFNATVNDEFTVLSSSMTGEIDLSIKNGKLDNFEPLQKMSNFLFKNRDFDNVQFGEISTRLTLAGTEIEVDRMEVESSVLRLFLQGRYSLGDSTNLSIQLPLSNLKKRDKSYQPKNIGVDTKAGPSIFVHVYKDPSGKTVFAYDPFKRHVKK